jgi:hypothetical protein
LYEVHSVTGAVVDPQLGDALSNWLDVSEEARLQAHDTLGNTLSSALVGKSFQPAAEDNSLAYLEHV